MNERRQVDMIPWGEATTTVQVKPSCDEQTKESKEKRSKIRMKVGSHTEWKNQRRRRGKTTSISYMPLSYHPSYKHKRHMKSMKHWFLNGLLHMNSYYFLTHKNGTSTQNRNLALLYFSIILNLF